MSKYESQITEIVNLRGTISILDLAKELGVSGQTVRRVCLPLVERGELDKFHGALVSKRSALDLPFLARMSLNREAKIAIAKKVAEIIQDGDSVAIDAGSTSAFVAQALRARSELTVVTNSAFVASTLSVVSGNGVFMAGTQLRNHDGAAFDRSAFNVVDRMQVKFQILSASLVDPEFGFLVHEQCEVDMAVAMKRNSATTIMAVDQTKFITQTRKPAFQQPALEAGDFLVTDNKVSRKFENLFKDLNVVVA
ncbi:MAG: DeoR/GlpR family DNA-binding transcription regulator [Pseudomonadota bacterium]